MNHKPLLLLPLIALFLTSCLDIDEPKTTSTITVTVGDISFEMVYVAGGSFTMGATEAQIPYARQDEKPTHKVTLGSYYICKTEITAAVWNAIMNDTLSGANNKLPVANVSFDHIMDFLTLLNLQTGCIFYLPTEAQWEYAARGGADAKDYLFSGSDIISSVAVHDTTQAFPVGKLTANSLGINDMSGNVAEWCYDWYGEYSSAAQSMPTGPVEGTYRIVRGGSYLSREKDCRVSARSYAAPDSVSPTIGFRLILYPTY